MEHKHKINLDIYNVQISSIVYLHMYAYTKQYLKILFGSRRKEIFFNFMCVHGYHSIVAGRPSGLLLLARRLDKSSSATEGPRESFRLRWPYDDEPLLE